MPLASPTAGCSDQEVVCGGCTLTPHKLSPSQSPTGQGHSTSSLQRDLPQSRETCLGAEEPAWGPSPLVSSQRGAGKATWEQVTFEGGGLDEEHAGMSQASRGSAHAHNPFGESAEPEGARVEPY